MKTWDEGIELNRGTYTTLDEELKLVYVNKEAMELIADYLGDEFYCEEEENIVVNRNDNQWGESPNNRFTVPSLPVLKNRKWNENISIAFISNNQAKTGAHQVIINFLVNKVAKASLMFTGYINSNEYKIKKLSINNSTFFSFSHQNTDGTHDNMTRQICFYDNYKKMFWSGYSQSHGYQEFDLITTKMWEKNNRPYCYSNWNYVSLVPYYGINKLIDEKIYELLYTDTFNTKDEYFTNGGRLFLKLARNGIGTANNTNCLVLDVTDEE